MVYTSHGRGRKGLEGLLNPDSPLLCLIPVLLHLTLTFPTTQLPTHPPNHHPSLHSPTHRLCFACRSWATPLSGAGTTESSPTPPHTPHPPSHLPNHPPTYPPTYPLTQPSSFPPSHSPPHPAGAGQCLYQVLVRRRAPRLRLCRSRCPPRRLGPSGRQRL